MESSFSSKIWLLIAILPQLFSEILAGEFCGDSYNYCTFGCCGYNDEVCCTGSIALIVGVSVGCAGFLVFCIVAVCICCKRSQSSIVYSSPSQPTMMVQSGTSGTQTGMVSTVGGNSGMTYNPYQPGSNFNPYQPHPHNSAYPSYPMQPQCYTTGPLQPLPYDSVANKGEGISNAGFS